VHLEVVSQFHAESLARGATDGVTLDVNGIMKSTKYGLLCQVQCWNSTGKVWEGGTRHTSHTGRTKQGSTDQTMDCVFGTNPPAHGPTAPGLALCVHLLCLPFAGQP
jgi:hypothetical protein